MTAPRIALALAVALVTLAALAPGAAARPPGDCTPPIGPQDGSSLSAGTSTCEDLPAYSCEHAWAVAVLYDPRGRELAAAQTGATACPNAITQGTWRYAACVGVETPRAQAASLHHSVCPVEETVPPARRGVCSSTARACVLADPGTGQVYHCDWTSEYAGAPTGCQAVGVSPPPLPPPPPPCAPNYACVTPTPPGCRTAWAGTAAVLVAVEACPTPCTSLGVRVGTNRAGATGCDPTCIVYVNTRCIPP